MKIKFFIFFLTLVILSPCVAQSTRIEEKLMDCTIRSYEDGGAEFQNLINTYESLLIDEGFLVDGTAKSYYDIFIKLANGGGFEKEPSKFFFPEQRKIKQGNRYKIHECQKLAMADTLNFESGKLQRFLSVFDPKNPKNSTKSSIAQEILKILDETDFELSFYKIKTFLLFSWIDTDSGLDGTKVEDTEPVALQNALRVTIDKNNGIVVDDQKISLEELKAHIGSYEKLHTSESVIIIKTHRSTLYRNYIEVLNSIKEAIQLLRDDMAKAKYHKNFDQLSEAEQSEIATYFPLTLVDGISD